MSPVTRADSRRAQWGPMTSESLGCASCLSAQAAIMGAKFSCCTNLRQRSAPWRGSAKQERDSKLKIESRVYSGLHSIPAAAPTCTSAAQMRAPGLR